MGGLVEMLGPCPGAAQPRAVGLKLCPLPSLRFWPLPPTARPPWPPPQPGPSPCCPPPSRFPACGWHGVHIGHLFHLLRNNSQYYWPQLERVPAPPSHKKPQSWAPGGGAAGEGRQRPRVPGLQLTSWWPERGPALRWARPQPASGTHLGGTKTGCDSCCVGARPDWSPARP